MPDKISRVSVTGMFVYKLVMSSEASLKCGSNGVSLSFPIRSSDFSILKAFGKGAR